MSKLLINPKKLLARFWIKVGLEGPVRLAKMGLFARIVGFPQVGSTAGRPRIDTPQVWHAHSYCHVCAARFVSAQRGANVLPVMTSDQPAADRKQFIEWLIEF